MVVLGEKRRLRMDLRFPQINGHWLSSVAVIRITLDTMVDRSLERREGVLWVKVHTEGSSRYIVHNNIRGAK